MFTGLDMFLLLGEINESTIRHPADYDTTKSAQEFDCNGGSSGIGGNKTGYRGGSSGSRMLSLLDLMIHL